MRFVHLADAHLDTPFYGQGEDLRRRLREGARISFSQAVDWALNRRAHAFLIAGDLFDNDLLSFATERFLLGELARLEEGGVQVFYATGNHDPGQAGYRAHALPWPKNVALFLDGTPKTVEVYAQGRPVGYVTGAGHAAKGERECLARNFPRERRDLPHVGLLHTQVTLAKEAGAHNPYAPSTREDLAACPVDYWALGHIHVRQQVWPGFCAYYPGNIQGRNPRETGPKGFYWVELEKGSPKVEFVPSAPLEWLDLTFDLPEDEVVLDGLIGFLRGKLEEELSSPGSRYLVRLRLAGRTPLVRELQEEENLQVIRDELQGIFGFPYLEVQEGSLYYPIDLAPYRESPSVLGELLAIMDEIKKGELPDLAIDLAADPPDRERYLLELAEGLEIEAAARLIPGGDRR